MQICFGGLDIIAYAPLVALILMALLISVGTFTKITKILLILVLVLFQIVPVALLVNVLNPLFVNLSLALVVVRLSAVHITQRLI